MLSNNRMLILTGVLAFSITLAILLANRLAGEMAQMLALSVAVGVIAGMGSALLILRMGGAFGRQGGAITLTEDQANALFALLDTRQQISPDAFPLRVGRHREFAEVGGAHLADSDE